MCLRLCQPGSDLTPPSLLRSAPGSVGWPGQHHGQGCERAPESHTSSHRQGRTLLAKPTCPKPLCTGPAKRKLSLSQNPLLHSFGRRATAGVGRLIPFCQGSLGRELALKPMQWVDVAGLPEQWPRGSGACGPGRRPKLLPCNGFVAPFAGPSSGGGPTSRCCPAPGPSCSLPAPILCGSHGIFQPPVLGAMMVPI